MKIKKDKKQRVRNYDKEAAEQTNESNKFHKKPKLSSASTEKDNKNATQSTTANNDKPLKSVDVNIFKYFNELTSKEEKTRMEAALHLLQKIHYTKEPDKKQKELAYTLKRLIRGCGASTNVSRAGFFTALVGFLKCFNEEELTIENVFQTLNKELHVGATIANKEDADAVVGKILVSGALLHSGRLIETNSEHLEQIANILIQSTRHRTYHASLGFSVLCEIVEVLSEDQFESSVWPLLQKELVKPWAKQTLQTVHCLISVQKKFPNVVNAKFLKINFGGLNLLNPESFQYLHKIFWEHSNTDILTHPAFECFGSYIATSKHLSKFWRDTVEPGLENPTKLLEVETLKILTDILDNLNVEQTNVHELLTDNFMRMFIVGLQNLKQKKDETLKAFYADFLESLVRCCGKTTNDTAKVAVIKRLILPPGIFNIEKFAGNHIIHQLVNNLEEEGVKYVFQLYKSIFLGTLVKNPENLAENWLTFERINAGYMLQYLMQHKSVQTSYKWREEQLKFLFTCGIFYVTDSLEITKKETTVLFSKDFADQCKNMFYTCLQTKLSDIQQEQQLLFNLAEYCQEKMLQKHAHKYFRIKFDYSLQKSWKAMFESVSKSNKSAGDEKTNQKKKPAEISSKLQNVFNILLLNMGLQLFREPEMAGPAVDDLLKCMEQTNQQSKNMNKYKKSNDKSVEQEEELAWIEVVVDLFLHLLSQNNGALRNIVNALFPHLSENLSLSAVHQILSMLDMKNGNNPLSTKNEDEEEEEEKDDDDDNKDDDEDNEDDDDDGEDDDDDDEDDDDDDEDDDDDDEDDDEAEEDDEEESVTESDKLRNTISQALIASGGANGVDDDMDSVDLNEMTEEEGRNLDKALANAFKALKKSRDGGSQTKKSKSNRVKTTTVMHFRIRVLDLIEIYLQQRPSLLFSIEIMMALFNMLEYCGGDKLTPLQTKVEKVLTKLTSQKNYNTDDDLKEDNFVDYIRLVVEKKAPAVAYNIVNKMRNKCTCFLIENANKVNAVENTGKILTLCKEYAQEFIKSRNPVINITLLSDIIKLRWHNVWNIANDLSQQGLNLQTRTYRRIQIYEVLSVLYKNITLQKQNEDSTKKHFKKIEKAICNHIETLSENDSVKHSPKEFQTLLDLILIAKKVHQRLKSQSVLTSESTLNFLQNLRKRIRLESGQIYQRFCSTFKLQIIRNSEVQIKTKAQQDDSESESDNDGDTNESKQDAKFESKAQKRKSSAKELRIKKKQKKQQRLEVASRGLNGGIGFTQRNGSKANLDKDEED